MNRDNRRLRLVFALLVVTSLTLLTADLRGGKGGAFGAVRSAASGVFGPIERAASGVFDPIGRSFSAAFHSGRDEKRIAELQKQVNQLQVEHDRDTVLKEITPEAEKLGIFESLTKTTGKFAKVIGHGEAVDNYAQTITINVGSGDGIAVGMPVVASGPTTDGLIGKVVSVTSATAIVSLMSDPKFSVGVDLISGPVSLAATAVGNGPDQPMQYQQIAPATQQKAGTQLVTAGDSSLDRGIPVGILSATSGAAGGTQQVGTVKPFVDGATAQYVLVLVTQARDAPRSYLQPVASPTPSATPRTAGKATAKQPAGKASGSASPSAGASTPATTP